MHGLDYDERLQAVDIEEGQKVALCISAHNWEQTGSVLIGEVTENLSRFEKDCLRDGHRPMADMKVESDEGEVWCWNVDNGYVIGPVDDPDRPDRSDIGKFKGFWQPSDVPERYK